MLGLHTIVVDTPDPDALASFWSLVLGVDRASECHDRICLSGVPSLAFHQVDRPTPGKNRLHIDLSCEDPDGEVERLLGLGADLVSRIDTPGSCWAVLSDPDGNEFCLIAA